MEEMKLARRFVPSMPTLWPSMMLGGARRTEHLPFSAADAHWFYFARNAVWFTAKMMGLDQGEVLVPAYHHGVEIEALVEAGVAVRFYRVGMRWDVDLEDVERKISPRTRALYLIHYAGFPGPAAEMRALADRHGVPLIEDCALSLLSTDAGVPLGSTGDVGIFCLYKTLPVPHGGALVVSGPRRYSLPRQPAPPFTSTLSHTVSSLLQNLELRAGAVGRSLRSWVRGMGRTTARIAKIERVATGTQHFNQRHVDLGMSSFVRHVALAQDMASIVERRRRNYFFLLDRLRDVSRPMFNQLPAGACPLFFPLVVEEKTAVAKTLAARGIDAVEFWRHFHPACDATQFPDVARLRNTVLEIPCHQDLGPDDMTFVADAVREAMRERRNARLTRSRVP